MVSDDYLTRDLIANQLRAAIRPIELLADEVQYGTLNPEVAAKVLSLISAALNTKET